MPYSGTIHIAYFLQIWGRRNVPPNYRIEKNVFDSFQLSMVLSHTTSIHMQNYHHGHRDRQLRIHMDGMASTLAEQVEVLAMLYQANNWT